MSMLDIGDPICDTVIIDNLLYIIADNLARKFVFHLCLFLILKMNHCIFMLKTQSHLQNIIIEKQNPQEHTVLKQTYKRTS